MLPGHGPQTTIGAERATNPYLAGLAAGPGQHSLGQHSPAPPAACDGPEHTYGEVNEAMIRTHEAGHAAGVAEGQQVTLAGWVAHRRDHGGVVFLDLRDASRHRRRSSSATRPSGPRACATSSACGSPARSRRRPEGNENPELPTGDVEVVVTEFDVLSESAPLPFPIEGRR